MPQDSAFEVCRVEPCANRVKYRRMQLCSACRGWQVSREGADPIGRFHGGAARVAQLESVLRARLSESGATLAGPYVRRHDPVHVICREGHHTHPTPGAILSGQGVCKTCAGQDPRDAERRFRELAAERMIELCEPYRGTAVSIRMRCAQGHATRCTPNQLLQGRGFCWDCGRQAHDVFYVVADPDRTVIKLGISSGSASVRLRAHEVAGLTEVLRFRRSLPQGVARSVETRVLQMLREQGATPVRGREYFGPEWLPLVLSVVDNPSEFVNP